MAFDDYCRLFPVRARLSWEELSKRDDKNETRKVTNRFLWDKTKMKDYLKLPIWTGTWQSYKTHHYLHNIHMCARIMYRIVQWRNKARKRTQRLIALKARMTPDKWKQWKLSIILKIHLVCWIRAFRTKTYLANIACCAAHMWMDANCLAHLLNSLCFSITEHIRYKHTGRMDSKVEKVLEKVKEILLMAPAFKRATEDVPPENYNGQSRFHISMLLAAEKTFRLLNIKDVVTKVYKGPKNTGIVNAITLIEEGIKRRTKYWISMVKKTETFCQQVPIKQSTFPDFVLMTTIFNISPPCSQLDPIVQLWCLMSRLPALMAFPSSVIKVGLQDSSGQVRAVIDHEGMVQEL